MRVPVHVHTQLGRAGAARWGPGTGAVGGQPCPPASQQQPSTARDGAPWV